MPRPVILQIRKSEKVPTKQSRTYMWRIQFRIVGKIGYHQSAQIFKSLGGNMVENDSQFAKLLYDNYGEGHFSIVAWRKGREGFWGFWRGELTKDGFTRIKKKKKVEDKENDKFHIKIRGIRSMMKRVSGTKREELQNEIDDINEEINLNNMIKSGESKDPLISDYFKQTKPVYKRHPYKDLGLFEEKKKEENKEHDIFESWA